MMLQIPKPMIRISLFLLSFLLLFSCHEVKNESNTKTNISATVPDYAIVIHGGAGYQTPENHDKKKQAQIHEVLNAALDIGEKILINGGSSLLAVEKTINHLENSPIFNAGKGAVFTNEERNELDASVMQGKDHMAGAVGGVTVVKNPISAAIAVMQKSNHVMMVGKGAEQFAELNGLEIVDPSYFFTQDNFDRVRKIKEEEEEEDMLTDEKHGTVGCVALDKNRDIVAGTSTGGMTNKKFNRIGDSPIIGAGTYADNNTCGVSATGHGEYFIRFTVARDISARMEFKGESLEEAGNFVVNELLVKEEGAGGIISLDKYGNISMPFNTPGMYRGYAKPGERQTKIFKD